MAVQRLTAAYRSRPRPSSTLSAKASTTCPYYLDGDQTKVGLVIYPLLEAIANGSRSLWLLCSFQGSPEAYACRWWCPAAACAAGTRLAPVSQSSTACRGSAATRLKSGERPTGTRSGSVDVLGPTVARTARYGPAAPPGRLTALPRKEVIQPQLPLRLPCYDFTPVTSPTVDGSLPCGLGHRLRVLLTPVV